MPVSMQMRPVHAGGSPRSRSATTTLSREGEREGRGEGGREGEGLARGTGIRSEYPAGKQVRKRDAGLLLLRRRYAACTAALALCSVAAAPAPRRQAQQRTRSTTKKPKQNATIAAWVTSPACRPHVARASAA